MSDRPSLKERILSEKKKFSEMDAVRKKIYFRDYYLVPCLLILAVIGAIVWFTYDALRSSKTVYEGATLGFDVSDEGNAYLTDDFMSVQGSKYKKKNATLTRDALMKSTDDQATNMSIEMAFTTQLSAGMYDYVLLTEKNLEHFSGYDFYLDLSSYKSDDRFKGLEYYVDEQGNVYGIHLDDAALSRIGCEGKEIYLCFVYKEDPSELNEKLVEHLFFGES